MTEAGRTPAETPEAALQAAQARIGDLTEELDATNRGVVALLAELDTARAAEAQALADQQVTAERERIAQDLYEQVIHKVFGAGLALQGVVGQIQPPRAAARVLGVIDDLDTVIADLRTAVFGALETRHMGSGLCARLAELATESRLDRAWQPSVAFRGAIDETVPDDTAAELLGAARTLLAALPPEATAADLTLEADGDLVLTLAYDAPPLADTHALRALRTRATDLGGTLDVTGEADGGTRVSWQVPLRPDAREAGF